MRILESSQQVLAAIRNQYENFPYPQIPLIAKTSAHSVYLMNYESGVYSSFGSIKFAASRQKPPVRPRILVVGSGTFEPYVVAIANPEAEIIAVDISEKSLKKLRQRLFLHGLKSRVKTYCGDLCNLPEWLGNFHMIVASGVLHHLPDPALGLKALAGRLEKYGVMRLMLYSRHGRHSIYRLQELRKTLGIEKQKYFLKLIHKLPADHPLKAQFFLYSDGANKAGIQDGFFHVSDKPYDALEMKGFLSLGGLSLTKFLHSSSGQPEYLSEYFSKFTKVKNNIEALDDWQKIAVLDRLSELESNFLFWCAKKEDIQGAMDGKKVIGNPALQKSIPSKIHSKILGETISIGPELKRIIKNGDEKTNAENILGKNAIASLLRSLILLENE